MSADDKLVHRQGKISRFDRNASKSNELKNLLKQKKLVEIGKPNLYVTTGVENVLGIVGNDETISGSRKIRAKLSNPTLLLSNKYYKHLLVAVFVLRRLYFINIYSFISKH